MKLRRTLSVAGSVCLLAGLLSVPVSADYYYRPDSTPAYSSTAPAFHYGDQVTVVANVLNVRYGPGTNYQVAGQLLEGRRATLREVSNGWGRIDSGWIDLSYVSMNKVSPARPVYTNQTGYVNATNLNVRQGPGTNYQIAGQLTNGTKVEILESDNGWGRISSGWIDLRYISGTASTTPAPAPNTNTGSSYRTGSVRVTADLLNVRQGAGTGYARVGSLKNGEVVEVLEVAGSWGRISSGWISLNYTTPYVNSTHSNSTPSGTSSGSYKNMTAGTLVEVTADSLRVRYGAGPTYQAQGLLSNGTRVKLLEVQGSWGRIESGWISLDYVRIV